MKLVVIHVPLSIFMQVPEDSTDDVSKVEAEKAAKHILANDIEGCEKGDCKVNQVDVGPMDLVEIIEY
jgi:hypothetical protein